jgi:magnesium chelatase family protein
VPIAARDKLATQPCPCGYGGGPKCPCTPLARERYRRRISGPLLDRFDLRVFVKAVKFEHLRAKAIDADTATLRADAERARIVQRQRFNSPRLNASITPRELDEWCIPDAEATAELELGCDQGRLTARGVGRVLRVARTIADLDPEAARAGVRVEDVREAMAFRIELEGRG